MGLELRRRFTEHPRSVEETYGQHFRVALRFSAKLAAASGAAAVHAVAPWLCTTSASARVAELNRLMTSGARAPKLGDASPEPTAPSVAVPLAEAS